MKKLIAIGIVSFVACAGAEEKSFWSSIFSSAEDTDVAAEAAAKADSSIAQLTKQLGELKVKMDEAQQPSSSAMDELKKQYAARRSRKSARRGLSRAKRLVRT